MKILLIIALAFLCLNANGQSLKVTVSYGAMYMKDTTKAGDAFGDDKNLVIYKFHPGGWFDADYQGQKVYVRAIYIDRTDEFNDYLHKWVVQPILDSIRKQNPHLMDNYKKSLIKKYGNKYADDIMHARIRLGQPKKVVIEIIGLPDDINRTVIKNSIQEQYVYKLTGQAKSDLYYFTNGILTGIQD